MKLLDWMHRKFRQNSTEPLTNFTSGNSSSCFSAKTSFDEQLYHAEPTYSFKQSRQPNKCRRFSNKMKYNEVEEAFEEETSNDLFHGFLAIGTLGLESLTTEPPTPTFPMPFQDVTHKEIDITENELKLINNELEKFLDGEAKEVTHESSARSSYASIITFSNKQLDDTDAEGWGYSAICPLQNYLFGSSIELPETAIGEKKEKTSLEELFRRTDTIRDYSPKEYDNVEKQAKQRYKMHFMKKMLKKLHSTARSCATASSEKAAESVATKRKLPKVLKIFHRKVHPEELIAEKQFIKADKDKISKVSCKSNTQNKGRREKERPNQMVSLKKEITPSELLPRRIKSDAIEINGEHWIKTDADYLVLEL